MYKCSAEQYEVLYHEAGSMEARERIGLSQVAAQRTQTTKAGEMLYVRSFPIWNTRAESGRARAAKPTQEAQRKLNQRRRRLYFEQLAHANFSRGDYFLTLTYTPTPRKDKRLTDEYWANEPMDMQEAHRSLMEYLRKLRARIRRRGGEELKYLGVTEETWSRHVDAYDDHPRYHHHLLISRSGMTRDEVEQLWKDMGHAEGRTNCRILQPDKEGIAALCAYLTKMEKGRGKREGGLACYSHSYTASRNLVKPITSSADRKLSRRRVARVAMDVMRDGVEIFRALYPGYEPTEPPQVFISDWVAGAYIYCRLRRREGQGPELLPTALRAAASLKREA